MKGNIIYLATKNITIKKPSKKLDYKYLEPYKVTKRISENNYQLNLPFKVRIHLIFHISLLKDAINVEPISAGRNNVKVDEEEYEATLKDDANATNVKLINAGRNDVKVEKENTKQKKFSIYVTIKKELSI